MKKNELAAKLNELSDTELASIGYGRIPVSLPPGVPKPHSESLVASRWWADQLSGKPTYNDGSRDPITKALADLAVDSNHVPLRMEQVELFRQWLLWLIESTYFGDNWKPAEPNFASYFRVIDVDYGPGPILRAASALANIPAYDLRFPVKTTMWVNPGSVKVRAGYGAEPVELLTRTN